MMNKKAQVGLGDLYPAVLTIILVGIILGIGIYVLNQTQNAVSTTALRVTNETITTLNDTVGDNVAKYADCGAHGFVAVYLSNATTVSTAIPSTNYTLDAYGNLRGTAGSPWLQQNVNITYTYTGANANEEASTGSCGAMESAGTGIGTFASWIAVIVVVLAAAIVLGIVISSFARKSGV